jgi:hypothetical protein
MELKSYLEILDIEDLKLIAKKLRIPTVEKKEPSRAFLIDKVRAGLLNYNQTYWVYKNLEEETKKALSQLLYCNKTIYPHQIFKLNEYGISYSGIVPDDLKEMLQSKLRNWIIREVQDYKTKVSNSLYLKAVRLLKVLKEEGVHKLDLKKAKSVDKFQEKSGLQNLEKRLLGILIDYFERKSFVDYKDKILKSNRSQIETWLDSYPVNFKEFYLEILSLMVPDLFNILKFLAQTQHRETDWVDTEVLSPIIGRGSKEKYEQTGLVEFFEKSGVHYIQLTNEGCFFAKGSMPSFWTQKPALVSAASEVFVPCDYNPKIVTGLISYGSIKSWDYYLIFDLEPIETSLPKVSKKSLLNLLEESAQRIPEVVLYELR